MKENIISETTMNTLVEVKGIFDYAVSRNNDISKAFAKGLDILKTKGYCISMTNLKDEAFINGNGVEMCAVYSDVATPKSIKVFPTICVKSEMKSNAVLMENEHFYLIKIDCKNAVECDWNTLFSSLKFDNVHALNVDSLSYELGASCWWESEEGFYSYVLLCKDYLKDRKAYIENYAEGNFWNVSKVGLQYALMSDDHCRVGYIWNNNDCEIQYSDSWEEDFKVVGDINII